MTEGKREKDKGELEFLLAVRSCCYAVSPFPDVWVLPYKEAVRTSQFPPEQLTSTLLRDLYK